LPEDDTPDSQHDVVVANILANPLQVLAPALCQRIAPNGHIVLSGILERQADEVIATYLPWIQLHVWRECDGWVCLTGQLQSKPDSSDAQKKTLANSSHTAKQHRARRLLGFGLLTVLLIVVLLQGFYLSRQAIALQLSKSSPSIQASGLKIFQSMDNLLCQKLTCDDFPVREFSAWAIELANLKINPPQARSTQITGVLELQIRNKLNMPVVWPHLLLTVTDANDQVLAEKLLDPQDWLPAGQENIDLKKGSQGPEEISSNVYLNLPDASAGYRLRVLYVKEGNPAPNDSTHSSQ
jgi:ribosomal protein L11 methyltransferase